MVDARLVQQLLYYTRQYSQCQVDLSQQVNLFTYFIAISVERTSSTLDLCLGRRSSRIGLSVGSNDMNEMTCHTLDMQVVK